MTTLLHPKRSSGAADWALASTSPAKKSIGMHIMSPDLLLISGSTNADWASEARAKPGGAERACWNNMVFRVLSLLWPPHLTFFRWQVKALRQAVDCRLCQGWEAVRQAVFCESREQLVILGRAGTAHWSKDARATHNDTHHRRMIDLGRGPWLTGLAVSGGFGPGARSPSPLRPLSDRPVGTW